MTAFSFGGAALAVGIGTAAAQASPVDGRAVPGTCETILPPCASQPGGAAGQAVGQSGGRARGDGGRETRGPGGGVSSRQDDVWAGALGSGSTSSEAHASGGDGDRSGGASGGTGGGVKEASGVSRPEKTAGGKPVRDKGTDKGTGTDFTDKDLTDKDSGKDFTDKGSKGWPGKPTAPSTGSWPTAPGGGGSGGSGQSWTAVPGETVSRAPASLPASWDPRADERRRIPEGAPQTGGGGLAPEARSGDWPLAAGGAALLLGAGLAGLAVRGRRSAEA
ncbi:hypothetical protein HS048_27265 [Planomonospora sp. ID91781]|uniref:hypothetical protein n=1 Tax=Planomonospora sp. ID91781 TaxID=2738135 RepID=UPI0018C427DE|nr:hypothetical protein [Planomonospora sp. ID91781]MBG0824412.1 hypothetical protein [Planomonospora sp. ID91781]